MSGTLNGIALSQEFARKLPELTAATKPIRPAQPELLVLNSELAGELQLTEPWLHSEEGTRFLLGNELPHGIVPVAQNYAGHQFGIFTPRLGDGRAVLLGELRDTRGQLRDLHLKGSGPTPLTRGDGFATVGAMLREHLMGEAMHALGIATTRALAVIATGHHIARDELIDLAPAAVLVRTASSHIRVGSFQLVAFHRDVDLLRRLADYAIARHYPQAQYEAHPYLAFLRGVIQAQASLVASWMLVGFVHGVMNTDNMSIAGETIDYGPCAFIDAYDRTSVFSSIDREGRYAFGNQPAVANWNLTRFAETLLPLLSDQLEEARELATAALSEFSALLDLAWVSGFRAKLGLAGELHASEVSDTEVLSIMAEMLADAQRQRVDYTRLFRALAQAARGSASALAGWFSGQPLEQREWYVRWHSLGPNAEAMDRVNPAIIPRNHLVDEALEAAQSGQMGSYERLLARVTAPYEQQGAADRYALPAPPELGRHITYCGT